MRHGLPSRLWPEFACTCVQHWTSCSRFCRLDQISASWAHLTCGSLWLPCRNGLRLEQEMATFVTTSRGTCRCTHGRRERVEGLGSACLCLCVCVVCLSASASAFLCFLPPPYFCLCPSPSASLLPSASLPAACPCCLGPRASGARSQQRLILRARADSHRFICKRHRIDKPSTKRLSPPPPRVVKERDLRLCVCLCPSLYVCVSVCLD